MPSVFDYKIQFVVGGYFDVATGSYVPFTSDTGLDSETGATIAVSASGATTLVTAVAGKKIRVTSLVLVSNGTVNVKFQSHVTPTDITGLAYLVANTGFSSGYNPKGHFQTISGEALDINLSGNVAVGGWLKYVTV